MASNIKFKRSAVQNRVPTTAQLDLGELALNTYDGKLYTEINTGSAAVIEIGSKLSSLVVDGDNGGGGGDVVFHGTTAARDLTWDYSDNSLKVNDEVKLKIGTSEDLLIWHGVDGSENSYITQQTGKHLIIKANSAMQIRADSINLWNHAQSERYIACTNNSSVELYYDNSKKLETTSTGVALTGNL